LLDKSLKNRLAMSALPVRQSVIRVCLHGRPFCHR
jgi:hypothetical protein